MAGNFRAQRLNQPTLQIPLRNDDGDILEPEVWREDILVIEGVRYLVLDFGLEEKRITIGTLDAAGDVTGSREEWRLTGNTLVSLQMIDDNGNGMATPTTKRITPPEGYLVQSWPNTTLIEASKRRGGWVPPDGPPILGLFPPPAGEPILLDAP